MKIAIYKAYGSEMIFEVTEWRETNCGYIRLSEIAEVEFPMLPPEVTVPAELKMLDAAEAELRNKFNEKLSDLLSKRANLLALTHEVSDEQLSA